MRQMLLDLGHAKPQTFATFVTGANRELLQFLPALAERARAADSTGAVGDNFAYLWGEPGAGKTHLLRALESALHAPACPGVRYLSCDADEDAFSFSPEVGLYLLDDCERLSDAAQIAAFALFNQVREHRCFMVAAGAAAPAFLHVREDLRTRFGWGLIYQLHALTDDEKIAALTQSASARGLILSPGVLPYLMTHFKRDMRSLSAMLDALDDYSLETKRPITLPLLRTLLNDSMREPLQQETGFTAS